jgi:FtsP/CotA-like multicopper oxidase with cupredoxin domain
MFVPEGTFLYHDHVMDLTWRNVYMGLLGMYIVEDEFEQNLPLPKGKYAHVAGNPLWRMLSSMFYG